MPSLKQVMLDTGIMNNRQVQNLAKVLREVRKIEKGLSQGLRIEDVLGSDPAMLEDLVARLVRSNLVGSSMVASNTGSSLLMAHAGSRWAREWLNKLPIKLTKEIIKEALEKPELMAALLTRGRSAKVQRKLERQVEAFLWQTIFTEDFSPDAIKFIFDWFRFWIDSQGYRRFSEILLRSDNNCVNTGNPLPAGGNDCFRFCFDPINSRRGAFFINLSQNNLPVEIIGIHTF